MTTFFNIYGFLIVTMMLGAVLGLSLYLPLMTGQLSLASPGFFAIGGYTAAILSTKVFPATTGTFPLAYLLIEMLLAGALCAVVGVIVGIPALRLRGIYLALATIAFGEVVRVFSQNLDITGGAVGIFAIPQPFPTKIEYAWVALPLLIVSALFVYRLERVRVGRAFAAIRDDELAAAAMGVNVTLHRTLAFVLGAIMAGVAGAVSAHLLNTWNARQGTFDVGVLYLTFVIVGGSRTFVGPIVGGLALTALPEVLRAVAGLSSLPLWLTGFLKDGRLIIYGLLIAFGIIFFPQGLITPDLFRRRSPNAPVTDDVRA